MNVFPRLLLIAILMLAGCANFNSRRQWQEVNEVYAKHGALAQDSLYACLLSEYAQGISVQDAANDCALKLLKNGDKGYEGGGGGGILGPMGTGGSAYDPGAIVGACSAGDPKLSSGPLREYKPSDIYKSPDATHNGMELWGKATYGGAGASDDKGNQYKGLSKDESQLQKLLAIMNANVAHDAWQDKQKKADQETDPAKKNQLQDEAKKAHDEYDSAFNDAYKDPNVCDKPPCKGVPPKPAATSATAGEESLCSQMLQAARELLEECNRSAWRTYACQQLQARMSGCPDPALIYVDPDSGYACSSRVDAEAVKNAWIKRCQQLAKYWPDGGDPCIAPTVDSLGRFISGNSGSICRSPFAYVDPESGACAATMKIDNFGKLDSKKILLWALDKLGGPIFIIPSSPPPCTRC